MNSNISRDHSEGSVRERFRPPRLNDDQNGRSRVLLPFNPNQQQSDTFTQTSCKMAAAIKAINAKIRSNKVADYVCSTRKSGIQLLSFQTHSRDRPHQAAVEIQDIHTPYISPDTALRLNVTTKFEKQWLTIHLSQDFWGPVSNFGIPVAAVMDTQKDPEMYVYA
jgi:hypothetical protein